MQNGHDAGSQSQLAALCSPNRLACPHSIPSMPVPQPALPPRPRQRPRRSRKLVHVVRDAAAGAAQREGGADDERQAANLLGGLRRGWERAAGGSAAAGAQQGLLGAGARQ